MRRLTWEDKIRMAKEADPSLTDEQAFEVVKSLTQFAEFALEMYEKGILKVPDKPNDNTNGTTA